MKKLIKILCVCLILLSSSLIFFACKDSWPKKLQKPTSVALVDNGLQTTIIITDENGDEVLDDDGNPLEEHPYVNHEYLIVTEKNTKASSYRFYITDSENYNLIENYVSYETSENYLNVTTLFDSKKEYHFFVQYIGNDKYIDSEFSKTESFIPISEKISAPYVQLIDENLYWTQIINAQSYEVYEKIEDNNNNVIQNSTLISTLNATTFNFSIQNRFTNPNYPYYKYSYSVRATSRGYYYNSDLSNKVQYIKEITLATPINLEVEKTIEDRYILSWDESPYCTEYEVKLNNNVITTTNSESLDVTNYLTTYATYTFAVKPKNSQAISFNEGSYSEDYNYNYTTKLDAPTSLEITTMGEYINISFDLVD